MSKPLNVKIFGDRALLKPTEEDLKGELVIGTRSNRTYSLGEVVVVGDGKVSKTDGTEKVVEMVVKPGDLIWFQSNHYQDVNNGCVIDKKPYMVMIQHDLLARLKTAKVCIENFEILGLWVLLEGFEDRPESTIILPENVNDPVLRGLRYKVKQVGSLVDRCKVGDEVVIERKFACPIQLNGEIFFYIDSRCIVGLVDQA